MEEGCGLKMYVVENSEMPKIKKIEIAPSDLWAMLLSTFRYSLGRSTYMTSYCVNLFDAYAQHLTESQRHQIVKEVKREVEAQESVGRTLGMQCDHDNWRKFIEAQQNE